MYDVATQHLLAINFSSVCGGTEIWNFIDAVCVCYMNERTALCTSGYLL
jgi:hypothetical protein